jgi:hypothetical protein
LTPAGDDGLYPTALPSMRVADYRETGSVSDDGAHIYEFDRYE